MESNLQYKKKGIDQKGHLEKKKKCAHKIYSQIKKTKNTVHMCNQGRSTLNSSAWPLRP